MTERFSFPRAELRRRTVRGALVTGGFLMLIDGLVLVQGLVVTRLLGPSEIGLYGVVSTVVISLIALKRVGIDELFVAIYAVVALRRERELLAELIGAMRGSHPTTRCAVFRTKRRA